LAKLKYLPYQKECIKFVEEHNGYAINGDTCGLGKTIEAIGTMDISYPGKYIIICTKSMKLKWAREIYTWAKKDSYIIHGEKQFTLPKNYDYYIINYHILGRENANDRKLENKRKEDFNKNELLRKKEREDKGEFYKKAKYIPGIVRLEGWFTELSKLNITGIIIDEAHRGLNNPKAIWTRSIIELYKAIKPKVFLPLTGTPIRKRPKNFYTMLHLTAPNLFPNEYKFYYRYCLPKNAPILMNDLTEKRIDKIKIGDKIIGWKRENKQRVLCEAKVKDIIIKEAPLIKVTLINGKIIYCTKDHRWLNGSSHYGNRMEYSIPREGRFGGAGIGCASQIVEIFNPIKGNYINTDDYKKGYIQGFFMGDGYCSHETYTRFNYFRDKLVRNYRKYIIGCNCNDKEPIERIHDYLEYFGIKHRYFIRSDGMYSISSNRTDTFNFLQEIENIDTKEKNAGFLGGIYDAEGSGKVISQYVAINKKTSDLIEHSLQYFNVKYVVQNSGQGFIISGIRKDFFDFWAIASPTLTRKLKSFLFNHGGKFMTDRFYVKKIEDIPGIHKVYTLTTTTGNYVAYGMGSKNCDPKHTRWGWTFDGATHEEELHELVSKIMIRRLKEDVLKELPDKIVSCIPMELTKLEEKNYLSASEELIQVIKSTKNKLEKSNGLAKLKQLAYLAKRNSLFVWIDEFMEDNDKLILGCWHKMVINDLMERYGKIALKIDGSVTDKNRQMAEDRFQTDSKIKIIILQIDAGGEGLTLTASKSVGIIECPDTPGQIIQFCDRAHRKGQTEQVTIYFPFANGTIENIVADRIEESFRSMSMILDGKESKGIFNYSFDEILLKNLQ
jgi:hypothetical protein